MMKWLYGTMSLICMLAIATGPSGAASAAAAPAATAREAPQFGACRWYCSTPNKSFTTAAACQAACLSADCEQVC